MHNVQLPHVGRSIVMNDMTIKEKWLVLCIKKLKDRVGELEAGYAKAIDDIDYWGEYAPEYYHGKDGYKECAKIHQQTLGKSAWQNFLKPKEKSRMTHTKPCITSLTLLGIAGARNYQ